MSSLSFSKPKRSVVRKRLNQSLVLEQVESVKGWSVSKYVDPCSGLRSQDAFVSWFARNYCRHISRLKRHILRSIAMFLEILRNT